ncbi:hypothetical protein GQ457_06G029790 [Hibiscus cannabinus]
MHHMSKIIYPQKEHNSYGEKGKPKSSLATEVPKENSRVGSSLMLKNKQTANVNNYTNKRESGNKKLERLKIENQTSSSEIRSEDWLKEAHKIEKTTSSVNSAHSDRLSGKKTEDLLATKSYPRTTVDGSSNSANVNVAGTSLAAAAAAPVLIIENWVHCDKYQKWRLLPININPADLPEKWLCSMLNWLPGMNHCNVAEEETTKAVFTLYQVPAVESLTNPGNIMSRLSSAALQPEQNQRSSGSHAMPAAGRKKHGLKEISISDKLPSTRMNVTGEDECCDAGQFVAEKTSFFNGSAYYLGQETQCADKSIIMDEHHNVEFQNDNRGNSNVSRPRKPGKGSSRLKNRNHNFKSGSFDEQLDRVPSYDGKSMGGRNKFQDRPGLKSNESVNRFDGDKEAFGKLSGESCKRENHSNVGRSDAKPDATGGSTMKQDLVQDRNGEKYKKRFNVEKYDHAEIAYGRGNSLSLPPAGGTQNKMLTGCPFPVSGSQKGNRADRSQAGDALKVQKQADHQNGSQHSSSRNTASGGYRIMDVDAPSQAATNALKEAKDLKHLADRLKNSGSNVESTALYFQAALKFLLSASLIESGKSESNKHGEMIQSVQMYSSTAKLCEFCAHEYERLKDVASASLAYKCMEVAYMRVIYSSHANASRDRHELQTALQMVPPGNYVKPVIVLAAYLLAISPAALAPFSFVYGLQIYL